MTALKPHLYRRAKRLVFALPAILGACVLGGPAAASDRWNRPSEPFVNWEDAHVHPLDLTPDGKSLLAVNTPDNSLMIFAITGGTPVLQATIPVGASPVSVRAHSSTEAWVVNRVSNNVSVVNLTTRTVTALVPTDTEPSDVVFAGSPQQAFITCAKPSLVDVFNPANLAAAKQSIFLYGKEPRALAVSADGTQVYAAFFLSGNATTEVTGGKDNGYEVDLVRRPEGPYGGINVPPNQGTQIVPALNPANPAPPPVSMIVRKNATGQWLDDNNGDWSRFVSGDLSMLGGYNGGRVAGWDLPDRDVAVINAGSLAVTYQTRLMNSLMALAVRPGTGEVTVVGTDATNQIRWEPNLQGTFLRVNYARFLPGGTSTIGDLNPHLDYTVRTVPPATRALSIGDPRGIVWSPDGTQAWVTGMGSNNVIVMNGSGARVGLVNVGDGPTGIVYQAATGLVYVLNKFSASISVINAAKMTETARVAYFDPTPPRIKLGRPFLYNTHLTSGLGQLSCASCHIDGRTDGLAWDLGNPAGPMVTMTGIDADAGGVVTVQEHPMKGPMLTSTLEDKMNNPSLHFSGDRAELSAFASAYQTLQGADAPLALASVNQLEDFLATIHVPPNPYRNLDNTYNTAVVIYGPDGTVLRTGNAVAGAQEFEGSCRSCHPGNSARGDKIRQGGGFGLQLMRRPPTWRNFQNRTGLWFKSQIGSTMGFGYQQDGSFDSTHNQSRDDNMMSFMYSVNGRFPYAPPGLDETNDSRDTHAAVGQQLLFSSAATSPQDAQLALFTQLADRSEVGLIAKATINGVLRGYAYVGDGTFQSDRQIERHTVAQVRALPGVVFTVVPAGSETRLGIDRDLDGVFNCDQTTPTATPVIIRSQTNVAVRGTAAQSSTYSSDYPASNAIDGNSASFSHTASGDTSPSWTLTLDDTYAIDRIVLVNRAGFESRSRDIMVYLLDGDGNPIYRSHFLNRDNRLGSPSTLTLDLLNDNNVPIHAKGIRIERTPDTFGRGMFIPNNSQDEQNVLALAEVQVYGTASNADALLFGTVARPLPGGTFEDINAAGTFMNQPAGTPWTFSAGAGISGNNSAMTAANPVAPEGTQVLFLQNTGAVTQSVKLLAGTYNLIFLAAQRGQSNTTPQTVVVSVDGRQIGSYQPASTTYATILTSAFTVTDGNHTIAFAGLGKNPDGSAATSTTVLIDNVRIAGSPASPVVASIAAQINGRLSSPTLQVVATDPNSLPLTYTATGLPAGLTINAKTGLISGTISAAAAGFNPVSVAVSNGTVAASTAFNWAASGNGTGVGQDGIVIDVDDAYTLYVNGVQIAQVNAWNVCQDYLLDLAPGDVLAVDAANYGGPGGLLAQLQVDGVVSGSSAQWKAAPTVGTGWNLPAYQDATWANATDYYAYGSGPWGANTVSGVPANTPAHWIWGATINDAHVYLRYTIPAPAAASPKTLAFGAGGSARRTSVESRRSAPSNSARKLKAPDDLPDAWLAHTVGGGAATGSAWYDNGAYTISAADAGAGSGQFEFVFQDLAGDGELVARLTGDAAGAQAGLMMRSSLRPEASFVFMGVEDAAWSFQSRVVAGGETARKAPGMVAAADYWVRLVRRGDVFSGYQSADGKTWTKAGATRIVMDHVVRVGMVVLSKFGPPATFDHVSLEGSNLPDPWTGADIGQPAAGELDSYQPGAFTLHGAGTGLHGTADHVRFVKQGVLGDSALQAHVTAEPGAVAGLMFREGLAPAARHVSLTMNSAGEIALQWRDQAGATGESRLLTAATGPWLLLERKQDVFNAYSSPDGVSWTLGGTVNLPLEDSLDAGMMVGGLEQNAPAATPRARFNGVRVLPANP
jgi:YVTN family beta-propeller protein